MRKGRKTAWRPIKCVWGVVALQRLSKYLLIILQTFDTLNFFVFKGGKNVVDWVKTKTKFFFNFLTEKSGGSIMERYQTGEN